MRVAAIYDIHGNLPALEAVLDEIKSLEIERIVVGGDMVPGPQPRETMAALLELPIPVHFIQGNGEREVLAMLSGVESKSVPEHFREAMQWNSQQLDPVQVRFLSVLPATLRLAIPDLGNVLFCHATPRNDSEVFTRLTAAERLLSIFENANASVVVCGHTHMQFERNVGRVRVLNAGSVGMPFGEPGAYWLLLGPDIQLRHTSYDLSAASQRIRATKYPLASEFATQNILNPPREAEMLKIFERSALK